MVLPTLAVTLAALTACDGADARLRLAVEGLRSSAGQVMVVLYGDRPEDFLVKGRRLAKTALPARTGRVEACLPMPRTGTFALAVYHDEDGDGRFGRSWLGFPAEGYGFSNDPPTIVGIPAFQAVAFVVKTGDNVLAVRMRYP